jgi:hypothetical protein
MIHIGWRARLFLIAVIPFAAPLSGHAEQQHRLQCPIEAPAEWGLSKPASRGLALSWIEHLNGEGVVSIEVYAVDDDWLRSGPEFEVVRLL